MKCLYCDCTENLEAEHLVPKARGGLDVAANVFRACSTCNRSKNDQLPSEWRGDLPGEVYELEKTALKQHPPLPPRKRSARHQKDEQINIRCTEDQKSVLEAMAHRDGLGVSTWLLQLALRAVRVEQALDREGIK